MHYQGQSSRELLPLPLSSRRTQSVVVQFSPCIFNIYYIYTYYTTWFCDVSSPQPPTYNFTLLPVHVVSMVYSWWHFERFFLTKYISYAICNRRRRYHHHHHHHYCILTATNSSTKHISWKFAFIFNAPTRSRDQRISVCIYYRINMADRSSRPLCK